MRFFVLFMLLVSFPAGAQDRSPPEKAKIPKYAGPNFKEYVLAQKKAAEAREIGCETIFVATPLWNYSAGFLGRRTSYVKCLKNGQEFRYDPNIPNIHSDPWHRCMFECGQLDAAGKKIK